MYNYLGILLYLKLDFSERIENVCRKGKVVYFVLKVFEYFNLRIIFKFYKKVVFFFVFYGFELWCDLR